MNALSMALLPDAKLEGPAIARFVLAGDARFTIVSPKTGSRFTFRVQRSKDEGDDRCFVKVLTGPDNGGDYAYLGTIFAAAVSVGSYVHGSRSRISREAPSAQAFAWFWRKLAFGAPACEVWHLGRCGRCGRDLTVPESIASGLGPECAKRGG